MEISGLANIVGAIKVARHLDFGPDDVVMTVATDGASMYETEGSAFARRHYPDRFDEVNGVVVMGEAVRVSTRYGGGSELTYITRSGREIVSAG